MKRIIRNWLGLNEEYNRLSGAILELTKKIELYEDGGKMNEPAKTDSLKEFVYHLAKYLNVKPRIRYEEVSDIITTKIVRKYEIVKNMAQNKPRSSK